MSRKNIPDKRGFVFSTDPDFRFDEEDMQVRGTLPPNQQKLRVKLDTKQRAGKSVTLVDGFIGTNSDIDVLGKQLKNFCGTGGSVKEGSIIIQGDQREKVLLWLLKNNYMNSKKI